MQTPLDNATEALRNLQNTSRTTQDENESIACKALLVLLEHHPSEALADAVLLAAAQSGEEVKVLWKKLELEIKAFITCRFKTPQHSQQSSQASSTSSSPTGSPHAKPTGSPYPKRHKSNPVRPSSPIQRRAATVTAVLARDNETCAVTGIVSEKKSKVLLLEDSEANVMYNRLEVAHIVGFRLRHYISNFENCIITSNIKEILGNGSLIDIPRNCITLSAGIHHNKFGITWWINCENDEGGEPTYQVEVSAPGRRDAILSMFKIHGKCLKFSPEHREQWPHPELCNLAAKIGRVRMLLAEAEVRPLEWWNEEDEDPLRRTYSEETLQEVSPNGHKKIEDWVEDLALPTIAI